MAVQVETTHGRIEGEQRRDHQRFLGIPYAQPPTGPRRFRAPESPKPWRGVRPARAFGPSAPQGRSLLPGMAVSEQSEDCLTLNVYTPRADGGRRPMMVWIHGGGFTGGSGSQPLYDGGRLAARGQVVVATLNYRLGALGYLYLDGVDSEAAVPNAGQLDQIRALEWLRDNAPAFGGDAENVTIFGESAGGMAVSTLLAMPAAAGLFHRAVAQSGASHHTHAPHGAARVAEVLIEEAGLAPGGIEALRALPVEKLLDAQARTSERLLRDPDVALAFAPVVDGRELPEPPLDAVARGAARDVSLLIGTNRDESRLFRLGTGARSLDEERLVRRVRARIPGRSTEAAERLIACYRAAGRASATAIDLLDAIESDRSFRIPAIRLAEAQYPHQSDTYAYLFSWESPAWRGALGACHALELPFVFGTLEAPTMDRFAGSGPDAEALSERMMDAWIAFACSGNPSHAGLPPWPPYDDVRRATMIFDRESALCDAPFEAERAAWDGLL